jgi:hypothetical protein
MDSDQYVLTRTTVPSLKGSDGNRIPMILRRLTVALLLIFCVAASARDHNPLPSPVELMKQVVANELADREQQRKFLYQIDKRDGGQTLAEEQVDTKDGPLYRVLAINGMPLNSEQRQQDNARIDRLLQDPSQLQKLKQAHDEDEQKLERLMRLMPDAFLFDYDGTEGNLVRLTFRPNPNYNPPNYEARVAGGLAGTILIDPQQKRLAKFSGQLIDDVQFGYGILGHIDKGSTIEMGRVQVAPSEWKTSLIDIHISGRLVFFKTIAKRQYENRSDFRPVASDLSLADASHLLSR